MNEYRYTLLCNIDLHAKIGPAREQKFRVRKFQGTKVPDTRLVVVASTRQWRRSEVKIGGGGKLLF